MVDKASVFSALSMNYTWIIDTGVSDHMTNVNNWYENCGNSSTSLQTIIITVDGSPTPVIWEGSVVLSKSLTLDSVLIVPSLSHNLLFVS